jgi:opacity protein-like surface antigen
MMFTSSRRLALGLAASALLIGGSARAQDYETTPILNPPPPDLGPPATFGSHRYQANTGLQVGARVGYGGGAGIVYSGLDVTSASAGGLPIIVDLGARVLPQLYGGLYGQFAPIFTKNNPISCPDGFDCNAQQWRFGVQFDYHYAPRSRLDPYVGLGGGYEVLHTNVTGPVPVPTALGTLTGNAHASITDRGWEFVNLTFGFDGRFNRAVALGPFVTGSIGEYGIHTGTEDVYIAGTQVAAMHTPNVNHGVHELFFGGLRGTFNP